MKDAEPRRSPDRIDHDAHRVGEHSDRAGDLRSAPQRPRHRLLDAAHGCRVNLPAGRKLPAVHDRTDILRGRERVAATESEINPHASDCRLSAATSQAREVGCQAARSRSSVVPDSSSATAR